MKRVVFLSIIMIFCTMLVAAAEVDFTIKPTFNYGYYDFDEVGLIPGLEVGVSVMPQLDLVGKIAFYYDHYEEGYEDTELAIVPGLGARYTFWRNKNIDAYAFGIYSFPIFRQDGEPADFKLRVFDLGLGGVCRLNENFALIGETGVQRTSFKDTYYDSQGTYLVSTTSVGLRFYF